jgi:hypothetical protein
MNKPAICNGKIQPADIRGHGISLPNTPKKFCRITRTADISLIAKLPKNVV